MASPAHSFDVLIDEKMPKVLPECVVLHGDDGFLVRETTDKMLALAGIDAETTRTFDGEDCDWIDVHDELATLSLFASDERRVAVVARGDKLLKSNRPQIEKWVASPAQGSLLFLQLHSLLANTKVYKQVSKTGLRIACGLPTSSPRSKSPDMGAVKKWLRAWAEKSHELIISARQAELILEAVGTDCGLLHQELAKLALYSDSNHKLSDDQVRANVGSWRTRSLWDIADSVVDGRITDALEQLEKIFAAGEAPAAVIPQISWSLRRFGNAAALILQAKQRGRKVSPAQVIGQCGFWGKDVQLAEQRIRRMGLLKSAKILDWLLELDLKIKGSHSNPARAMFALEELCLRFA